MKKYLDKACLTLFLSSPSTSPGSYRASDRRARTQQVCFHPETIMHLGRSHSSLTTSTSATAAVVLSAWVLLIRLEHGSADGRTVKKCHYRTNGTCLNLDNYYCPAGHKVENRGCGFKESCCYPYVLKEQRFEYGNENCGVTSKNWDSRIIGGDDAFISEYPWTVSIQKSSQPVCGGSIIGKRWILTAAHCVDSHTSSITVVIGSSKSWVKWSDYTKRYHVFKILKHSGYTDVSSIGYDIALVKLTKDIYLGGTLTRSVCLPDYLEDFTDRVCVATGWGYTKEPVGEATSEGGSKRLRAATLPVISRALCHYYTGTRAGNVVCAGYTSGGEDTCQGDSGGPLVCQDHQGVWKQAGIVSTGRGCGRGDEMGIYTQVSAYTKWIAYAMEKY